MADAKNFDSVRKVLAARRQEIVKRYNAAGAGIGRQGDEYCITVYLKTARDRPKEPVRVEGIPLKFEVTGEFRPHGA